MYFGFSASGVDTRFAHFRDLKSFLTVVVAFLIAFHQMIDDLII